MILACRNVERANAARDDIIQSTGNNDVIVMTLDLASLRSVRQFAEDFNRSALSVFTNCKTIQLQKSIIFSGQRALSFCL